MSTVNFIKRQYVDVSSQSSMDAFDFREELSAVCTDQLLPAIESTLDQVITGGDTLCYDLIAIDLGEIPVDDWQNIFVQRVVEEFKQRLTQRRYNGTGGGSKQMDDVRLITGAERSRQIVFKFLESGSLSWNADLKKIDDFHRLVSEWIDKDHRGLQYLMSLIQADEKVFGRMIHQFGDELLDKILLLGFNMTIQQLTNLKTAIITSLSLIKRTKNELRVLLYRELFRESASIHQNNTEGKVLAGRTASPLGLSPLTGPQSALSKERSSLNVTLGEEEETYIPNSGLVLLGPFIDRLFENLGYTEQNAWKSVENQQRAICLLQFAVTGEIVFPEYRLMLNKILTGYNLEDSIPHDIELSDFEMHEAIDLLESMIQHWRVLKNTSVDGLRAAFLQRQGKIYKGENEWHLKVQQETLDILLDKLPWTFSVVKTPWMKNMLKVEWS